MAYIVSYRFFSLLSHWWLGSRRTSDL